MNIPFSDFQKLVIRVGTICEVMVPEGSEKLYRIVVDCGEEIGKKVIFSGIKKFYTPEELIGKQIVVLLNLMPRSFFGEEGQGMLLAADDDSPVILTPIRPVSNGSVIR